MKNQWTVQESKCALCGSLNHVEEQSYGVLLLSHLHQWTEHYASHLLSFILYVPCYAIDGSQAWSLHKSQFCHKMAKTAMIDFLSHNHERRTAITNNSMYVRINAYVRKLARNDILFEWLGDGENSFAHLDNNQADPMRQREFSTLTIDAELSAKAILFWWDFLRIFWHAVLL